MAFSSGGDFAHSVAVPSAPSSGAGFGPVVCNFGFAELTPVEVFKAQRIFKCFCNKAGNITREKWQELCAATPMCKDYERLFGDYCWLHSFLGACKLGSVFINQVWKDLALEPRQIDDFHSSLENKMKVLGSTSEAWKLEALLAKETDWAVLCAAKLRLAALLLGNEELEPRPEQLTSAKVHLDYVLQMDPACWEAHRWLAVVLSKQGNNQAGLRSARRSLILNKRQPDVWDLAGCLAAEMGNFFHAGFLWSTACAQGSYAAAMHYGKVLASSSPHASAAAFKLAMQLARSTGEASSACAHVQQLFPDGGADGIQPLEAGSLIEPELDIGKDEGDHLLF